MFIQPSHSFFSVKFYRDRALSFDYFIMFLSCTYRLLPVIFRKCLGGAVAQQAGVPLYQHLLRLLLCLPPVRHSSCRESSFCLGLRACFFSSGQRFDEYVLSNSALLSLFMIYILALDILKDDCTIRDSCVILSRVMSGCIWVRCE